MTRRDDSVGGLRKGLGLLRQLNAIDGVSVADMVRRCSMPRTTVLRLLETLRAEGYLLRTRADRRYRLTIKVRELADGFSDEVWVSEVVRPHLRRLGDEVLWPVFMATASGATMTWRESTDRLSPLGLRRYPAGFRIPVLASASGHAHLAWCESGRRERLLDLIARTPWKAAAGDIHELPRPSLLESIQKQGYAVYLRAQQHDEGAISVPILVKEQAIACLTLRFCCSMLGQREVVHRYLPTLRSYSTRIAESLCDR